ncbi:XRE family transcriptional regulator (plasmid) [Deinococcus psychrotolerans]|uniref:XRE family transcriptional regulator n=1 Tax=Deinococcus psychrotolerans TaxID=2489213 RepID=A0A3G8YJ62_9DEIO|nr:XRE family transcriptional regulator [Deinococcus psychrotolerans]
MAIGTELRRVRTAQNRSVLSVAESLGVHPQTIRYAEREQREVNSGILLRWAGELGYALTLKPIEGGPEIRVEPLSAQFQATP